MPLKLLKLTIRRSLSALARWKLRRHSHPFPIGASAITLVLSPHQDDETLGCGGVIPQILGAGHAVHVIYITDGGASPSGYSDLSSRRQVEALAATALLGLPSAAIEFLNAHDGSLAQLDARSAAVLIAQLSAILHRLRPTLVLLPCRTDGSSEHDATYALFARALATTRFQPRVLEFPIWSWWNPLLLCPTFLQSRVIWRATFPDHVALKQRALATYVTQLQAADPDMGPMLTPEFVSFFTAAEEFFFEH